MSEVSGDTLPPPLLYILACAALHHGLRSLLLLDTPNDELPRIAAALSNMVELATGQHVETATLSAADTDDTLWGSASLYTDEHGSTITWQPGMFTRLQDQALSRLIVIPDLSALSVIAARACTVMIGADVAVLERHGHRMTWQPQLYWIAGCPSKNLGRISPHLLDRFALRVSGQSVGDTLVDATQLLDRVANQEEQARSIPLAHETTERGALIPPDVAEHVRAAANRWPLVKADTSARLGEYLAESGSHYPRRAVTLGRLAVAHARLGMSDWVMPTHVDTAARMLRLQRTPLEIQSDRPKTNREDAPLPSSTDVVSTGSEADRGLYGVDDDKLENEVAIHASQDEARFAPSVLSSELYPEDQAMIERDHNSLRLTFPHANGLAAGRGPIIGVERTSTARDLSIVGTVLEAAKYQLIRRDGLGLSHRASARLILSPADLRRNRRAMVPDHLLVLVIDFTSLHDCLWQEALMPYLHWAYVKRSAVCVIQVGASSTDSELRAERVIERRVQSPRIEQALESGPGKASPLAHGLDLALHTLRHQMQHGEGLVRQATLVVVTDGRCNVPLPASKLARIDVAVSREGIEDTLQVARALSVLRDVHKIVLDPQPVQYPGLPKALANMMDALLIKIPLPDEVTMMEHDLDKRVG